MRRYTPREVGHALGLSPVTIRSAIRRGRMRAERDERGRIWIAGSAVTMYDLQSRGQYGQASAHYRRLQERAEAIAEGIREADDLNAQAQAEYLGLVPRKTRSPQA